MISAPVLFLSALLAQAAPGLPPGISPLPPEHVSVLAIQASNTGEASMDPELSSLAPALETMPFDTFAQVFSGQQQVPAGVVIPFAIDTTYTLHVQVADQQEDSVYLGVNIEMRRAGGPVNALVAEGPVPRGQPLIFQGLENDAGQLVLVLSLQQPQQQQGDPEQEQEPEGDPEASEDEGQDGQEPPQEMEFDPSEDPDAQDEHPQPGEVSEDDMQNVEAILQSLVEQDRREQQDMHNRRSGIVVRGDWW